VTSAVEYPGGPEETTPPDPSLGDLEKEAIVKALERHGGDRMKAAAALGISIATLKRRLRRYREE
jgi:transcriptional regulator with PAS, ATPase and Fis domain